MDESLCVIGRSARRGRDDGARFVSRGSPRSPGVVLFRRDPDLCRAGSPQRPARRLALDARRRQRRPRRDRPSEYTAVRHRGRGRVETRGDRRQPQSDVSHAGTQQAFRGLRAQGCDLPGRSMGHRLRCGCAPSIPSWFCGPAAASSRRETIRACCAKPSARRRQRKPWRKSLPRIQSAAGGSRSGIGRRRVAALHLGHNGRSKGRHADAPQSRCECVGLPRSFRAQPRLAHFRGRAAVPRHRLRDPVGSAFAAGAALVLTYRFRADDGARRFPRTPAHFHRRRHHRVHRAHESEQSAERSFRQLRPHLFRRRADRARGHRRVRRALRARDPQFVRHDGAHRSEPSRAERRPYSC